LVESFRFVVESHTMSESEIMLQGFVIAATHFKTVSIGVWACIRTILEIAILPGPAIFQNSAHVIVPPHIAIPAIVNIQPCATSVKIIIGSHIQFTGKAISITIIGWISIPI